jgi:hypothetical protein
MSRTCTGSVHQDGLYDMHRHGTSRRDSAQHVTLSVSPSVYSTVCLSKNELPSALRHLLPCLLPIIVALLQICVAQACGDLGEKGSGFTGSRLVAGSVELRQGYALEAASFETSEGVSKALKVVLSKPNFRHVKDHDRPCQPTHTHTK